MAKATIIQRAMPTSTVGETIDFVLKNITDDCFICSFKCV